VIYFTSDKKYRRQRQKQPSGDHSPARGVSGVDAYTSFVTEVSLVSRRWRAHMDERLNRIGLTHARSYILFCLAQFPEGLCQRELADKAGIECPTLVRHIDILEHQGLITRASNTRDRRVKRTRLTPAAVQLLDEVEAIYRDHQTTVLEGLDSVDIATCAEVLRRVRNRLEEPHGLPPGAMSA
jgi:MarR family transcriptional regulator for hemolysin